MRALILGGTGFLGPSLVRHLLAHGHSVSVLHRGATTGDLPPEVQHVRGDRHKLHELRGQFKELKPDIVVDVIAATGKQTRALMDSFRGIARRVVVLSSGDVYLANDVLFRRVSDPVQAVPLKETAALRTQLYMLRDLPPVASPWLDWENYEKIDVERVALGDSSLPATILRLPMVYGPGDYDGPKRRFFAYLKRMADRRPFILLNEAHARWRAPWGYTENVASAVALAVDNDCAAGEIYNVCEPDRPTIRDLVEELAQITGWSGEILTTPASGPPPDVSQHCNLSQDLDLDSTKIRAELGYGELISRRDALARTVAWERDNPPRQIDLTQLDYAAEEAMLAAL